MKRLYETKKEEYVLLMGAGIFLFLVSEIF